jgi:putative phosphoesterase
MRVAALYDIHGNLPALEAVLHDIRQAQVDHIIVGGDVLPGPMPRETLNQLLNLEIPVQFIMGNGDRELLVQLAGEDTGSIPEAFQEAVRWVGQQLQPEQVTHIKSWAKTLSIEIPGLGAALFCHATPRNDTEIFTRLTPEERLLPVFAGVSAAIVICGHTHMQFDRTIGKIRVANAGSVGMPYGEPGAYWLLLDNELQFKRTLYDFNKAAELIRNTDFPLAQDFAAENILQFPSEADALEVFSKAELK